MRFIAHRANIHGKCTEEENTISKINKAIALAYDVEIDVRKIDNKLFLGHDCPQEEIKLDYLYKNKENLWIHAKDLITFIYILDLSDPLQTFLHDVDNAVLTNTGKIWTHPRDPLGLSKDLPWYAFPIHKNQRRPLR
mgnify:CR=1 FL=1